MSLILKIMSDEPLPDISPSKRYTLVSDVSSVTFHTQRADGQPDYHYLRAYVIEKVKTAIVPGFCENERIFDIVAGATVYVMNEMGKTFSSWTAPLADGGIAEVPVPVASHAA